MRAPLWKKVTGVVLIVLGVLALITPLTPGAWLILIGLELCGIRLIAWDRLKRWRSERREKTEVEQIDGQ